MSELLVEVSRGLIVESRHFGDIAVVDGDGQVLWSLGDAKKVTYARSSAKPLQALPLIESGAADHFEMSDQEIALTCASHSGESMHVDLVSRFLERIGVDPKYLQCGVHPPFHAQSYERLLRQDQGLTAIHNNCSGKHAGMLALAKYLSADLDSYMDPQHPVQQHIIQAVSEVCEVPVEDIQLGTDGCGVPVFALPLDRLAHAYAKFAKPMDKSSLRAAAMRRISQAMMKHPALVAGTDRFCTALMTVGAGHIVGKTGAEGVYSVGLIDSGIGICLKVDDGNARAAYPAVMEVLAQTGLVNAEVIADLETFYHPVIRNHQGTIVGRLNPHFRLSSVNSAT